MSRRRAQAGRDIGAPFGAGAAGPAANYGRRYRARVAGRMTAEQRQEADARLSAALEPDPDGPTLRYSAPEPME